MDGEFWDARFHRLSNSGTMEEDEDEVSDEVRTWFPCPFCYLEIEIQTFCSHLQQEHCFDLKNAVCPICAGNLGKDPLAHFTVQHAHSIKKREAQKLGLWNNASANIIKDLRELSSFLSGKKALSRQANVQESMLDPILSSFISKATTVAPTFEDTRDNTTSNIVETSSEVRYEDCDEKGERATFVQELLLSTIF